MLTRSASLLAFCGLIAAAQSSAIPTGPEPGQPAPAFTAKDQNGRPQTFESLRGPNGLVLLFVRSADW